MVMEGLLVPTNFTGVSDAAVVIALKLASISYSPVTFIHLISAPIAFEEIKENQQKFEYQIHKEIGIKNDKLNQYLEKAKNYNLEGIRAIQLDTKYHHLIDYVENNDIFMIVMGTHGMRGTKELLVGSNAQKVVRYSSTPVLVVKEGYGTINNKTIAFFSRFSNTDNYGFERIVKVAKRFKLTIDLVFVQSNTRESQLTEITNSMEVLKRKHPIIIRKSSILTNNNFDEAVDNYVNENQIDIVGMVTHPRKGYKKITDLSITEHMVNHLRYPILSVHN